MATKWKYATLDADTRLKMLRNGNKDVFDEEVERTKSVVKARKELGLDTSEQESWMDTVGYNYNLWNAEKLGESKDNVSKTGYAELYLKNKGANAQKANSSKFIPGAVGNLSDYAFGRISTAGNAAKNAINSKYDTLLEDAKAEYEKQYSYLEEALINSGTSLESGKASELFEMLKNEFDSVYGEYDRARKADLSKSEQKYAGLKNTLLKRQNEGTTDFALLRAANQLILEAAKDDGYDANKIILGGIALGSLAKA